MSGFSRTTKVRLKADTTDLFTASEGLRCQFVNLRMRTLRISPKPASVAIIDEPP